MKDQHGKAHTPSPCSGPAERPLGRLRRMSGSGIQSPDMQLPPPDMEHSKSGLDFPGSDLKPFKSGMDLPNPDLNGFKPEMDASNPDLDFRPADLHAPGPDLKDPNPEMDSSNPDLDTRPSGPGMTRTVQASRLS